MISPAIRPFANRGPAPRSSSVRAPEGSRRRPARRFASTLALASVSLLACNKDPKATATPGPVASTGVGHTLTEAPKARPPVELIRWSVDLTNLDETLTAAEQVIAQLRPEAPLNLRAVVESVAAQQGLPKAWTDALDWTGRFAFDIAYPQPGQSHARPEDLQLRGNFAAKDPLAALEAVPAAWNPQPLSERELQATRADVQLNFRALSDQLLVGRGPKDLDAAAAMSERAAVRAVQVHAENLHPGDVDPGELLTLPAGLTGPISAALERATALDASLDLARDRDMSLHLAAEADLSNFGFDPLGRPLTDPSRVADTLLAGAVSVAVMSWGDPKLIHRELDRYATMIPEPFDQWVAEVIAGAHAVIDVVRDEVVVGLWVDAKGRATLVIASRVSSEADARAALRRTLAGLHAVGERYVGLMGDDRNYRAKLEYKPDGLGFSKAKVDLLSSTVPKAFADDAKRVAMFVGEKKPKLEILSFVSGDQGLVAIGAGARTFMSDYVRNLGAQRDQSTESEGGLRLARALGGGCQLCIAIEPEGALRTYLRHKADFDGDAEARATLDELSKSSVQRGGEGHVALSLRARDTEAALGVGVSRGLLFGESPMLKRLFDALDLLPPPPQVQATDREPSTSTRPNG